MTTRLNAILLIPVLVGLVMGGFPGEELDRHLVGPPRTRREHPHAWCGPPSATPTPSTTSAHPHGRPAAAGQGGPWTR
ncbi:hypothetical protein LV779_36925 [Streptomyces thinghirensis]|nr:hypothetical protein [Streptomyces thinghirensis]